MRRAGTDPDNVLMSDVLCDFCAQPWTEQRTMVEGHHGSCICAECLGAAFRALVLDGRDDGAGPCTMCLESRAEPHVRGGQRPEARICRRCTRMASVILERDPDAQWSRPAPGGAA